MFVSHLESAIDGTQLPANQLQTMHADRPLWVRYNLNAVGRWFEKEKLRDREPSMWQHTANCCRYRTACGRCRWVRE